jgi:hypothetical protein
MDRRSVLKKSLTAGAGAALAAPAFSQGKIEWRMVTTWPKNFPSLGVGAENLVKRINIMSAGRLTIKVYSAGELVPPLQALDAVINGTAEMSHGAAYYWQNKNVGLSFFTGVPYGMTSREHAAWVRILGGQQIWDEIYDQFGVQGFLSGDTGTQAGGWFRKEINKVEDIKGLRFRTPGLGGQVWAKLGASVTNLAAGPESSRRCRPARWTRPSSWVRTTTSRWASTRSPRTTTSPASSSRAWPPRRWSTSRSTRRCRPTCRRSSAPPARPSTTRSRRTSTPTTRVRSKPWSASMA